MLLNVLYITQLFPIGVIKGSLETTVSALFFSLHISFHVQHS